MKLLRKLGVVAVLAAMAGTTAACAACGEPDTPDTPDPGDEVTVTNISLVLEADNTTYISGDVFDPTGITLRVTYSDGTSKNVTTGFTYDTEPLEVGDTSVTIAYEGKTATQAITVSDAADALIVKFGTGDCTRCYGDGTVIVGGNQNMPYVFNDGDDSSLANAIDYGGDDAWSTVVSSFCNLGTWTWDGEKLVMLIKNADYPEGIEVGATYNESTGVWTMETYVFIDREGQHYDFSGSCTKEQAEKYLTADRTWPVESAD